MKWLFDYCYNNVAEYEYKTVQPLSYHFSKVMLDTFFTEMARLKKYGENENRRAVYQLGKYNAQISRLKEIISVYESKLGEADSNVVEYLRPKRPIEDKYSESLEVITNNSEYFAMSDDAFIAAAKQ